MKKPHGNTGKRNAAKDMILDRRFTFRTNEKLMNELEAIAAQKKVKLSVLVNEILGLYVGTQQALSDAMATQKQVSEKQKVEAVAAVSNEDMATTETPKPIKQAQAVTVTNDGFFPSIKWGDYFLTEEQENALNLAKTGDDLKIEAYAGSGKTTLLNVIATLGLDNKKTLYCAFNKAIVSEAEAVFPQHVTCKTSHSLAGRKTVAWSGKKQGDGKFCGRRIGNVNASYILQEFRIKDHFAPDILKKIDCEFDEYDIANLALAGIDKFCTTADLEINFRHCWNDAIKELKQKANIEKNEGKQSEIYEAAIEVQRLACAWANRIWEKMSDTEERIRITHNVYLKYWQLSKPILKEYKVLLVDESQDCNELLLDVVSNQKHAQILWVGDSYQSIYSWNGAVNALTKIETPNTAVISQSFRFGDAIANLASAILSNGYGYDIKVKGFAQVPSVIKRVSDYSAFIARTNACLIGEMINYMHHHPEKKIAIEGGINELINLLKDAQKLKKGQKIKRGELAGFENWKQVVQHSKTQSGGGLKVLVNLCEKHSLSKLIKTLEDANTSNSTDECDVVFTTAHKSKGKEYKSVKLADDFREMKEDNNIEEVNLLYVAATRATHALDIYDCECIAENPIFSHLI